MDYNAGPPREKDISTVAQHNPLSGGISLVDSPFLGEKEKLSAAVHEITHALDRREGAKVKKFSAASDDPSTELGKLAADALKDDDFRGVLAKAGYRPHEMNQEAVAYLSSRWANKRLGLPGPERPYLDSLLPRLESMLLAAGEPDKFAEGAGDVVEDDPEAFASMIAEILYGLYGAAGLGDGQALAAARARVAAHMKAHLEAGRKGKQP